jgi:hypothetical protein
VIGTGLFVLGACFSLTAAAAARVAEAVVSLFVYRPHLERMTETTLKDMIPIYLRSALLTGLAIGPSMVLMLARGPAAGRTGLLMIVPAVVLGVLAWAVGLRLMRHRLYLEAMRLASGGLRRIRMAPVPSEHLHGTDLD